MSEPDARPTTAPDDRLFTWLTRGLVLVSAGAIAYLCLNLLLFSYGRDQGIYAMVADAILRGKMPYKDAWDFKPPGVFYVYALSRAIFGRAQWGIRLVEVIGLVSMVQAFRILSARFFGDARIGIVGGALGILVHAQLEFWHTAQPESFGAIVVAWALVLATYEPPEGDPRAASKQVRAWVGAGLLYGFLALLKPPLGGGAVFSAAFAASRAWKAGKGARGAARPVLVMGFSSAGLVAVTALYFFARGALRDLYEVLFQFTPHYTKLSWEDATVPGAVYYAFEEWTTFWSSSSFAGLMAALYLLPTAKREREGILHVFCVVGVQCVGVAIQGKYFPYHFGAALPLGGLLAGLGAWKAWHRVVRPWGLPAAAAYVAVSVFVLQGRAATRDVPTEFIDRCNVRMAWLRGKLGPRDMTELDRRLYGVADVSAVANREVAAWLREHTAPNDLVFIWGFEPVIYDLAEREPSSRYLYDVPQRVAWWKDRSRADLMAELRARPPRAFVVEHRDVFPVVTGDAIDSADTLAKIPELSDWLEMYYRRAVTIEDFDVWVRRGDIEH